MQNIDNSSAMTRAVTFLSLNVTALWFTYCCGRFGTTHYSGNFNI